MAGVTEQSVWIDEVRLIEASDPVQGGEGGIDNIPHQQLASRTSYLKKQIDKLKIPEEDASIPALIERIKTLEDAKHEQYKVGDIYTTTLNHADSSAVKAHLGYGTWQRFAEGKTLVGLSKQSSDPTWTKTIKQKHGEYEHTLTEQEIPNHKHSKDNVYNKFTAKANDVFDAGYISRRLELTVGSVDNAYSENEIQVGQFAEKTWALATEQTVGGGQSHNNVQPSIVVAFWLRTS